MERWCNCSNEDCFDKVPAEAMIPVLGERNKFRVRVVQVTPKKVNPVRILDWDDWVILCDNCRVCEDGYKWKPYVPANK
jgi:hypothetical protein